jgi:DNA-binding NtrC family response regulator
MPSLTARLKYRRIVIVEDDMLVKAYLAKTLSDAGAVVVRSFDRKIDAAILDVRLGGGVSSVPIAISLDLKGIPFMFYTGYADTLGPTLKSRWPDCKVVPKPSPANMLVEAVASVLKTRVSAPLHVG